MLKRLFDSYIVKGIPVILIGGFYSCKNQVEKVNPSPKVEINKMVIDTLNARVDSLMKEADAWDCMMSDPTILATFQNFRIVYSHPEIYSKTIIDGFLKGEQKSCQGLAYIYSLQKIDDQRYFEFMDTCVDLYLQEKLEKKLLYSIILPYYFANGHRIALNAKNPEVIRILNKLFESSATSRDVKEFCRRMLDGTELKHHYTNINTPEIRDAYIYPHGLE